MESRGTELRPALLAWALLLAGCEMGSDPQGPNIATISLRADDGIVRDFYLGGYDSVDECLEMVASEAEASAADRNNEFWTNSDYSYGGFQQEGWTRNVVVGGKCALHAAARP